MLNAQQQKAYDEILHGKTKIVFLAGEAGTGKSYTTAQIVKAYPGTVALTATTNKAKEVIGNMALFKAVTTHSFAGFNMLRNGRTQYLAPVRLPDTADLVIVEEISMLPLAVWNTLYTELIDSSIKKLLLLGDPMQLPAVGIGIDLKNIPCKIIELTQQMRQLPNVQLQEYFATFRKAIETKSYIFDPLLNLPSCIQLATSFTAFANTYKATVGSKKVIAYSNTVVDKYNTYINGESFFVDDEVIIDKPLGAAKNGDTVKILYVEELPDKYQLRVASKGCVYIIYHFKTKSAEEAYLSQSKSDPEYWLKKDMAFRLKHQYACTVHKSQGASYDTVFIDVTDIVSQKNKKPTTHNNYAKPIAYNTYLRLMYVAISRMRINAVLFVGDIRTYSKFRS